MKFLITRHLKKALLILISSFCPTTYVSYVSDFEKQQQQRWQNVNNNIIIIGVGPRALIEVTCLCSNWKLNSQQFHKNTQNIGLTIPGKLLVFRCGFHVKSGRFHVKSTWHSLPTALHATEEVFLKSLIYKVSRWISPEISRFHEIRTKSVTWAFASWSSIVLSKNERPNRVNCKTVYSETVVITISLCYSSFDCLLLYFHLIMVTKLSKL